MRIATLLTCFLVTFLLAAPADSNAASNLDCIAGAKGKKIRWNASWEKDRSDDNVEYRVTDVSDVDRIPTRRITLELKAQSSATNKFRTAVIDTEDRARALCNRIVADSSPLRFPDQAANDLESLPFVRFTKDGWVRAETDNTIPLALCRVGELRFSCPEADRQRFGGSLKTLEESLRAQVPVK